MDQKFIAGIGNIYSDEILYAAGLRYDRMSDTLTAQEIRRLYRAMVETLQEAVKHRGSSLADEQYVDLFGRPGEYQSSTRCTPARARRAGAAGSTIVRARYRAARPSTAPAARSEFRTVAASNGRSAALRRSHGSPPRRALATVAASTGGALRHVAPCPDRSRPVSVAQPCS